MGDRNVKVYVSSTVRDLHDERRVVLEWLRAARYQAVDSYLPDSETVRESCLADIGGCDLYVLILGWRYGFRPEDDNPERLSITHLEFREAGLRDVPRVALLRTGLPDVQQSDLLDPERRPLIEGFRAEVSASVRAAEFNDPAGLVQGLSTGVKAELAKLDDRRTPTDWLARHADDLAARFADHMIGTTLARALEPEHLCLDLVVVERRPESREADDASTARSLAELIDEVTGPVLVTGEGGAGKTTSLLRGAAEGAARAVHDPGAPVPIYVDLARLTRLDDLPDLHRLIADSVSFADDWTELTDLDELHVRRVVYLFDSLNELPEKLQRTTAAVLVRFIGTRQGRGVLVASRPSVHLDQLLHGTVRARMFEILRLRPEQVQQFLGHLGLGTLYERMPDELRELAGNPFMLLAVARTLAGTPSGEMPRNRGRLYERFVQGWMRNEEVRRAAAYHYERVKQPLLADLATRMTALGRTSLLLDPALEEEIEERLEAVYARVRRLGGMPESWTVDGCLAEVVDDGLLRRRGEELQFLHQSVQEYFTALHMVRCDPVLLAELTPRLDPDRVTSYELPDVPTHRLVPVLLLTAGLLDDATPVVTALADRHPVLAAVVIAAANRVDGTTLARLMGEWRGLLSHQKDARRAVACACLVRSGRASQPDIRAVTAMAMSSGLDDSGVARRGLERLDQHDDIATAIVARALALDVEEFHQEAYTIRLLLERLPARSVVASIVNRRSGACAGDDGERLGRMLATVPEPRRTDEVRALVDLHPRLAMPARDVLDDASTGPGLADFGSAGQFDRWLDDRRRRLAEQVAHESVGLQSAGDEEVVAALTAPDPARRQAAVPVATARGLDVADALIESIVRNDFDDAAGAAAVALAGVLGATAAVDMLVRRMREPCLRMAVLDEPAPSGTGVAELPEAALAEVHRFRPGLKVDVAHGADPGVWTLQPRWSDQLRYEVRTAAPGTLELWDCNIAVRAVRAMAVIDGPAATAALWNAADDDDPRTARIAVEALPHRQVADLVPRLMARLRSRVPSEVAGAVLAALATAGHADGLELVDDLLRLTPADPESYPGLRGLGFALDRLLQREQHPDWGRGAWGAAIHRVLVSLDADDRVRATLDDALGGTDVVARAAAAAEHGRWFDRDGLAPERRAAWGTPERMARVIDLALHDEAEPVRSAAAMALVALPEHVTVDPLRRALHGDDESARVAAAEALVGLRREDDLVPVMLATARGAGDRALRRRACAVLGRIQDGLEALYRPIQRAFEEGDPHRALELVGAALEVLPEDVNIHWWQGHALSALGRPAEAAESFQRAADVGDENSAVVLQALAETLLDLDDIEHAVAAARHGVELASADAGAHAVLAWCSYRAGAIDECVDAATRALDRDPVHPTARSILLLAHIRRGDRAAAGAVLEQARRVRELLLTGPEASFVADALDALDVLDDETARLRDEARAELQQRQ